MSALKLTTEGDRHIVVTRRFAATPEMVYRARGPGVRRARAWIRHGLHGWL